MKKVFLAGALALGVAASAQQGFKLGAHIGIPTGDAHTAFNFTAGADAAYMWPVGTNFNLGLATGYSAFFGKTVDLGYGYGSYKVPTLSMVPVAASAQYMLSPEFSIGVDLGYGFLFASGESDGGFHFQPKAAYHFGPSELYLGYAGVSKNGTLGSVNLGYAYSFGK